MRLNYKNLEGVPERNEKWEIERKEIIKRIENGEIDLNEFIVFARYFYELEGVKNPFYLSSKDKEGIITNVMIFVGTEEESKVLTQIGKKV